MITVRRSSGRGKADHGWLQSYHTFSFAGYFDPNHMGFRSLRVMNEDRVQPGKGFGTHSHDNMEIISFVLSGSLEHKDSMGNGEVLKPGEFQRISAGTGITHSEFNHSHHDQVHFYQIWIEPNEKNITPSYEQKQFDFQQRMGRLQLVASPNGADGSLLIHQDAKIYLSVLNGQTITYAVGPDRHIWIQALTGDVSVNEHALKSGDGVAITDEKALSIAGEPNSELMLFDLS